MFSLTSGVQQHYVGGGRTAPCRRQTAMGYGGGGGYYFPTREKKKSPPPFHPFPPRPISVFFSPATCKLMPGMWLSGEKMSGRKRMWAKLRNKVAYVVAGNPPKKCKQPKVAISQICGVCNKGGANRVCACTFAGCAPHRFHVGTRDCVVARQWWWFCYEFTTVATNVLRIY